MQQEVSRSPKHDHPGRAEQRQPGQKENSSWTVDLGQALTMPPAGELQEECLINGMPRRLGVVVVVVVVAPPPVPEFKAVVGKLQLPETQS